MMFLFLSLLPLSQAANDCFLSTLNDGNPAATGALGLPTKFDANNICVCDPVCIEPTVTAFKKDGNDWDHDHVDSYASGSGGFFEITGNQDACISKTGNIYFHGEEVIAAANTIPVCSSTLRKDIGTTPVIANGTSKIARKMTALATAAGTICDGSVSGGASIAAGATARLKHNQDGDGAIPCLNLPYETNGKGTCTATQVCDWFNDAANPCVTKTLVITDQWVAAAATKNWCMPGDGTADQATPWKWRKMASGEAKSAACADGSFCNWGRVGTDPLCLTAAQMLSSTKAGQARATGDATKYCLSGVGAKVCTALETCDPNSTTYAGICTTTLDGTANASIIMSHGQTGDDAKTYLTCFTDGKAKSSCDKTKVCNQKAGATSGDTCIAHAALIGDFATGGDWTAAKQVRGEPTTAKTKCMSLGAGAKDCVATPATDLEICNPNATALADLCVKKSTTLNHNQEFVAADTTATPNVLAKEKCVAKTNMATCTTEQLCNQGSGTNTCINKTDVLENRAIGDGKKFCFGTDAAEVCTKDTHVCNVNGKEGGSDAEAICVAKDTKVAHLAEAKDTVIVCIGDTASSKYDKDDEANKDNIVCDEGSGAFGKKADKMAPGELQKGTGNPFDCYGEKKKQVCLENYYCNPKGSDATECATGADADPACSVSHICIKNTSVIADAQSTWVKDGTEICMAEQNTKTDETEDADGNKVEAKEEANAAWTDGTPLELCTETKQYCILSDGTCSENASSADSEADGEDGKGGKDATGASNVGIAASLLAMLSTL